MKLLILTMDGIVENASSLSVPGSPTNLIELHEERFLVVCARFIVV